MKKNKIISILMIAFACICMLEGAFASSITSARRSYTNSGYTCSKVYDDYCFCAVRSLVIGKVLFNVGTGQAEAYSSDITEVPVVSGDCKITYRVRATTVTGSVTFRFYNQPIREFADWGSFSNTVTKVVTRAKMKDDCFNLFFNSYLTDTDS